MKRKASIPSVSHLFSSLVCACKMPKEPAPWRVLSLPNEEHECTASEKRFPGPPANTANFGAWISLGSAIVRSFCNETLSIFASLGRNLKLIRQQAGVHERPMCSIGVWQLTPRWIPGEADSWSACFRTRLLLTFDERRTPQAYDKRDGRVIPSKEKVVGNFDWRTLAVTGYPNGHANGRVRA